MKRLEQRTRIWLTADRRIGRGGCEPAFSRKLRAQALPLIGKGGCKPGANILTQAVPVLQMPPTKEALGQADGVRIVFRDFG